MTLHQPPLPIIKNKAREKRANPNPNDPTPLGVFTDICNVFGLQNELFLLKDQREDTVKFKRLYCYVANVLTSASSDKIAAMINCHRATYYWHAEICVQLFESNDYMFMALWERYVNGSLIWNSNYRNKKRLLCQ